MKRTWSAMCIVLWISGAVVLIWSLLTVLLVEDRHAYMERARDWRTAAGAATRK